LAARGLRDVIEQVQSERLDSGIEIQRDGPTGDHLVAGGPRTSPWPAEFAAHAVKCADRWPRTAVLVREMERKYKGEAR
jgi:hypothetical protein